MESSMHLDVFGLIAIAGAILSAVVIIWYLVARPALTRTTKIALLFGIGVFPIATAGSGNYAGLEATKMVRFCGSCHVMTPYANDARDPASTSLAAIHTRNAEFGEHSCYTCHANYGMFGFVKTKMGGMNHVVQYVTSFRSMTLDEAIPKIGEIHQGKPFQSSTCMRCHTGTAPTFKAIGDHAGLAEELKSGKVGCVGEGCHGPAHPWSKIRPFVGKDAP
jgi:nitrate/TMAO reductase-like tetraheme cytochrome c subunit